MDYHDYVIKDGVFIGKFEEMYQSCDNPWHQKDSVIQAHKMACMASIDMLKPQSVLEVGCGFGYVTSFYQKIFPAIRFVGMDISSTAIYKAKKTFPECEFICENIAQIRDFSELSDRLGGGVDVIIMSEIMWYILDELDEIIKRLKLTFNGKYLLINQSFYAAGDQKYGREFFTNPDEMINYFGMECVNRVFSYSNKTSDYDVHVTLKV